jgi:hypothetical protein
VEDATIGGITAPVVGSGVDPAWMARVEKPGRSLMRRAYADPTARCGLLPDLGQEHGES